MRLVVIAAVAIALAGCSGKRADVRAAALPAVALPAMSDADLSCAVEPTAPKPRACDAGEQGCVARVTEVQVAEWILALRSAGADCRDRLDAVRRVWRSVETVHAQGRAER